MKTEGQKKGETGIKQYRDMENEQSIKRYIVRDVHGNILKENGFSVVGDVHVTVEPGHGEPSADVEYVGGELYLTLHNIEGNGITEIITNSQEGDDAVNTVTIKTNDNPEGVVLQVRNGSRGNGIASSSETLSPHDGGTNTHTFVDTDGNNHVFHGHNGDKGDQGDSAIWTGEGDPWRGLKNTTGQSTTEPMTQKAVTDKLTFYEDVDISNLTEYNAYINGSNVWTSNITGRKCIFIPVVGGTVIHVMPNYSFTYAFLTSSTYTSNTSVSTYAEGYTGTVVAAQSAGMQVLQVPSNAKYLYCISQWESNDRKPSMVRRVGLSVKDEIANINNKQAGLVQDMQMEEGISVSSVEELQYYINNSNQWQYDSTNQGKSKNIPIKAGKTYKISASSENYTAYAFLSSDNIAGDRQPPSFAEGVSGRTILGAGNSAIITAPINAAYLNLITRSGGTALNPQLAEVVTIKEALSGTKKAISVRLQRMGIDGTTGKYAIGPYKNRFSTSKLYRTPSDRIVKLTLSASSTTNGMAVIGYDKAMKYVGQSIMAATKDEPVEVEMAATWTYFKLLMVVPEYEDTDPAEYPDIVDMVMEGRFASDFEHYNMPQVTADSNGNYFIPMTINLDIPTPIMQDVETSTVNDVVNIGFDHGLLALPATYTADGTPTRLIIFCHGATAYIGQGATSFPSNLDAKYWLSEGYAVMDMDGLPDDTSGSHWCAPVAYLCYLAAYKHVIDNYNIYSDGVFLAGYSMGGIMALLTISFEQIPVKACCTFSMMGPMSMRQFWERSSSDKKMIADYCGIYDPEGITWPGFREPLPIELLTMEYTTINGHMKYIGNFGRLMQYSPSYRLIVNNPSVEAYTADEMFMSPDSAEYPEYIQGFYSGLVIKTKTPVKIFASYADPSVPYWHAQMWTRMFRNGGCIVELRLFTVGAHNFFIDSQNRVSSFVTSKGDTLTNVPIAFIEALQFWRNYE